MRMHKPIGALALLVMALLLAAGAAQAKEVQRYFYNGNTFDAGTTSSRAIAFDNANQKVLVVSSVSNAKGPPVFVGRPDCAFHGYRWRGVVRIADKSW